MVIRLCFYRKSNHLIFSKSFFSAHLGAKDNCSAPLGVLANCHISQPTLRQRLRPSSTPGLTNVPMMQDVPVSFVGEATRVRLLSPPPPQEEASCRLPDLSGEVEANTFSTVGSQKPRKAVAQPGHTLAVPVAVPWTVLH